MALKNLLMRYRAELTDGKHWKGNVSVKMHMAFSLFILILISGKFVKLIRYIFKLIFQTRPLIGLDESNLWRVTSSEDQFENIRFRMPSNIFSKFQFGRFSEGIFITIWFEF